MRTRAAAESGDERPVLPRSDRQRASSGTLEVFAEAASFRKWLEDQLYERFGRTRSNRSISLEAGLAENALYRVLTRGDRPTEDFCVKIAAVLALDAQIVMRNAGLQPLARLDLNGECEIANGLTPAEITALTAAIRRLGERLTSK